MKVNEHNRSSLGASAATAKAKELGYTEPAYANEAASDGAPDTHLAELVRSLRSLAAESPERQAKIEGLMSAYACGDLSIDAEATASAIIDDATLPALR